MTFVAPTSLTSTVKHMAGVLWYEMLSELNQSGLDTDSLGAGGANFQDMFLWNIAQNDFGTYDSALTAATLRQVGGTPDVAPAAAPFPMAMLHNAQFDAAGALTQMEETSDQVPFSANLASQAKAFAKSIWPQVTAAAQALGVPAVAVLAQTALETGWGAAAAGHNLFGIKAVDGEAGTARATHEMVDGVLTAQTSEFRDYSNIDDSVSDYVRLIQAGYPQVAGQRSVGGFAAALQQGGYATDSGYAAKIIGISQSALMGQVLQAVDPGGNFTQGGEP